MSLADWRERFIGNVYTTHNRSATVRDAVAACLKRLRPGERGINVGSGGSRLHPDVFNVDLISGPGVDFQARAESLPFADNSVGLVVTQETLEHVQAPFVAVREMFRVLAPGGTVYCQVPFTIGYHPGPTDFWRFSREGIGELLGQVGFVTEEVGIAVGPGFGFYRVAVEFAAVVLSLPFPRGYRAAKGLMALAFVPLQWADPLLSRSRQADRIAGGYYAIARKPA